MCNFLVYPPFVTDAVMYMSGGLEVTVNMTPFKSNVLTPGRGTLTLNVYAMLTTRTWMHLKSPVYHYLPLMHNVYWKHNVCTEIMCLL